jgi:hypothetical protein
VTEDRFRDIPIILRVFKDGRFPLAVIDSDLWAKIYRDMDPVYRQNVDHRIGRMGFMSFAAFLVRYAPTALDELSSEDAPIGRPQERSVL